MAGEETEYIHERIDQLVRQTALEVGLLRLHAGVDPLSDQDLALQLTRHRFAMADRAAAETCGHLPREGL
jgi:hypothetical protein